MNPHDSPSHEGQSSDDQKRQRRRRLLAALGAGIVGAYVAPTLFSLGQAQAQHAPGHFRNNHVPPGHAKRRHSRPSYSRPSYSRPSYSRPSGGRRRHSHQHGYRWDEHRHYRDNRHYLHDRNGVRLIISVSPSRW